MSSNKKIVREMHLDACVMLEENCLQIDMTDGHRFCNHSKQCPVWSAQVSARKLETSIYGRDVLTSGEPLHH